MKMTIEFPDEQLTQLLKSTFFGAWLKNATKAPEDRDAAMDAYVQYVLSTVYTAGDTMRVNVDARGVYSFAPAFEEVLFEQIDEYDEDIFWDELTDQLARRDYWQKNPGKIGKEVTGKAADDLSLAIEREKDKYDKEFEDRGVERLRIVR